MGSNRRASRIGLLHEPLFLDGFMLDFRPRVQARDYLSRREQRRLLAWVMGIGLIVIVGASFAEIRRFLRSEPTRATPSIDTSLEPGPGRSSEADAVTMVKSAERSSQRSNRDESEIAEELLGQVRDDTPWIRNEEIDAWLSLWGLLKRSSDAELARRSTGKVGFVELFGQPRAFRGKLVTIRGSARQAIYLEAAENSEGIEGYYRVVLWPEGGPAEPVFVYALTLPAGFPTGEEIREDIEATGFFFKRMVYPARDGDGLRRAPVVMARTLGWLRPAEAAARQSSFVGALVGVTVLGVIGLIVVVFWAGRTRTPTRQHNGVDLAALKNDDIVGVEESLGRLAENDR